MKTLRFLLPVTILLLPLFAAAQNSAPIANAGEDQSIYFGDRAHLHGTATDPDGDPIVSWEWGIAFSPAGSTATLQFNDTPDPYFDPDVVGDYIVGLVVSDGIGQSAPDAVIIHVAENLPPTAIVVADVTSGPAPLVVSFDGTQSFDPEGRALRFLWNFRDGTPLSTSPTPVHEYTFRGDYVALLQVTDDLGQTDSDTVLIHVTEPSNNAPVVAPTASPESGTAPLLVQFAASVSDPDGDALTITWDFGDGTSSSETDPAHTYVDAGTYVAWVTAGDGQLSASGSVTITVDPAVDLSIAAASVKYVGGPQTTQGQVEIQADVTPGTPAAGDVIALYFDDIELFVAAFSEFSPDSGTSYQVKAKHLFVTLDTGSGRLSVIRRKVELSALDPSNGAQVELHVGADVAVETIILIEENGRRWTYVR